MLDGVGVVTLYVNFCGGRVPPCFWAVGGARFSTGDAEPPGRANVQVGDSIVYRKQSRCRPGAGPRVAYEHSSCRPGGHLSLFCRQILDGGKTCWRDGRIVVMTRTKKHHYFAAGRSQLMAQGGGWIARLRHRNRFPVSCSRRPDGYGGGIAKPEGAGRRSWEGRSGRLGESQDADRTDTGTQRGSD